MSSSQSPSRGGEYREDALDYYGRFCQECTWGPETEAEEYKLHVHLEFPEATGGPDAMENLTVLCRDCHLARHSESAFSHELVGRLTNALSDALQHKRDGFSDRVGRRVRLDTVYDIDGNPPANFANASDDYVLVEGIIDGDHYDSYFVDTDQPYLSMCSCYTHSFGVHRAHEICTHVGAAIVRLAIEIVKEDGEEAALSYVREMGERLDEKAQDYVHKQELIDEGLDTLDIEERFSESWAQRASAQAKKMTRYGDEWKAFGSECAGCEIRLTSEGFSCSDACEKGWENKFPCPGKLGAYILNKTGGQTVRPNIDEGHLFYVTRNRGELPVEKGEYLVATDIDGDAQTISFLHVGPEQEVNLDFDVVTDAIIASTLKTTTTSNIERFEDNVRVIEENGIPVAFAPKVSEKDVFHVKSDKVGYLAKGDTISVVNLNDDERKVVVERAVPDQPFGGDDSTIDYEAFRYHVTVGNLERGYISDVFDIVVTDILDGDYGEKAALYSPFEAKEDIKSLDWEKTHRSWDSERNKWTVDADSVPMTVTDLREMGWAVWVPRDVREAT